MQKASLLFVLFLLIRSAVFGQAKVIDIADRLKLPPVVYDSLKQYRIILCGETHGTNEAPEFIEGLARLWVNAGQKLMIALEIPQNEQKYIDSFLLSGDFLIIQRMPFFTRKEQDGRSSAAMANLLKNMYGLKNLKVKFFDTDKPYSTGQERDSMMADNVAGILKDNPDHKLILLAGDLHSRLTKGMGGNSSFVANSVEDFEKLSPAEQKTRMAKALEEGKYRPMGYFLEQNKALFNQGILALQIDYKTGSYWACTDPMPNCKTQQVGSHYDRYENFSTKENFLYVQPYYREVIGYTGVLYSTHISASRPLKE